MTFGSNPHRPVRDYAFLCILALGAALRLYHVTAPFLDAHAWRQLDTAAMARNFYEGPFFPLDPRVDWGGRNGYLEDPFIGAAEQVGGRHPSEPAFASEVVDGDRSGPERKSWP